MPPFGSTPPWFSCSLAPVRTASQARAEANPHRPEEPPAARVAPRPRPARRILEPREDPGVPVPAGQAAEPWPPVARPPRTCHRPTLPPPFPLGRPRCWWTALMARGAQTARRVRTLQRARTTQGARTMQGARTTQGARAALGVRGVRENGIRLSTAERDALSSWIPRATAASCVGCP
jgi:hypothetical protein